MRLPESAKEYTVIFGLLSVFLLVAGVIVSVVVTPWAIIVCGISAIAIMAYNVLYV